MQDLTPSTPALDAQVANKAVYFAADRIVINVDPAQGGAFPFGDFPTVTLPIESGISVAADGNNDETIDPENKADQSYLFWVNDDHDIISNGEEDDANDTTKDSDDSAISTLRDLEDFARLHVSVDSKITELPNVTYHLKYQKSADSNTPPEINLFEAVNTEKDYLIKADVADKQKAKTRISTGPIGANEVQIDSNYIVGKPSPFIFEGKTEGKGKLVFTVKLNGVPIKETSMDLELKSIKTFYDKYALAEGGLGGSNYEPRPGSYVPKEKDYVLFVHGWNVEEWLKERWAETMFKRLWWQQYKGHVGMFSWPTLTANWTGVPGPLNYDRSELRSWNSAPALNSLLKSLNITYPGKVRVLAHSMGNVVAGDALRLAPASTVSAYIASQAAIPAHMYDNAIPTPSDWNFFETPNVDGHYYSGASTTGDGVLKLVEV